MAKCAICNGKTGLFYTLRLKGGQKVCQKCANLAGINVGHMSLKDTYIAVNLSPKSIKEYIDNDTKIDFDSIRKSKAKHKAEKKADKVKIISKNKQDKKENKADRKAKKQAEFEKQQEFKNQIKGQVYSGNDVKSVVGKYYMDYTTKEMLRTGGFITEAAKKPFSSVINYRVNNEGRTDTKKAGIGKIVLGDALFGVAGAVIAGRSGKNYNLVTKLSVTVYFDSGSWEVKFISSETKVDSLTFKLAMKQCNNFVSKLESIMRDNKINQENRTKETVKSDKHESSVKKQLEDLKELLDEGIINEKDFEAKKKQILGI